MVRQGLPLVVAVATAVALPVAGHVTAAPAPLCKQAGFWGTASCLATRTGSLAWDATTFAASGVLPTSWWAPVERIRKNPWVAKADRAWRRLGVPTVVSELPNKLSNLVDYVIKHVNSRLPALERHRAAFTAAFPEHAALLPDARGFLAALVWLTAAVFFWRRCAGLLLRANTSPEVYFFPDKSGKNVERICAHIASSRRRVWVAMFTLTDDSLSREIQKAHSRGVDVRLIVDDEQCQAMGADADTLAIGGVPVVTDCSAARMHHKFAILDHAVLSGSFNWTKQASHANSENLCVLRDPATIKAFSDEFTRMWAEFSGRGGRIKAKDARRRRDQTPPVKAHH